ncbi:unnamed protein product [Discosporangium mesarthrocarpum]
MKDGRVIYLHPEEEAPKPPRAYNKRFITKVLFLAAVARPRMISDGVWFDGKIGILPIADTVAAMCSSKNRKKGIMMLKPVRSTRRGTRNSWSISSSPQSRRECLPTRSHDLCGAGWCKAAQGGGGHGVNSGKGGGQHHPRNPACQFT